MIFLGEDLPSTLNITACLRKCKQVLIEIIEFQFVEKLKILSLLRVLDLADHLHIGVDNRLLLRIIRQLVEGVLHISFS